MLHKRIRMLHEKNGFNGGWRRENRPRRNCRKLLRVETLGHVERR